MKTKILFFLLPCVVVLCTFASLLRAQSAPLPDARQLLQGAHEVSGLTQVLPYSVHAAIVINPGESNEKKGQITIYRDQDRSRTDLQVEEYREIKVTLGNKLYIWRSTPAPVPALGRLAETDHTWDRLAEDGEAKLGDVSRKKVQNTSAVCFEVKGEQRRHLCFDPARKVLLENLDQRVAVQFTDYTALDQLLLPRKITVLAELEKSEKPILVLQDIDVQKARFAATSFSVPEHSMEFETCEKMQPAKPLQTPRPEFGNQLVRKYLGAGVPSVNVYGIIDKDGNLQNIKILSSDAEVQQSIREALKKWRYSPAMCGSSPVAAEKEIQVPFSDFGDRR
jgi:hypothetical protein